VREPLTREEYDECVTEYIDQWTNSAGSAAAELTIRIKLRHIGMDADEIDYIIRTYRPN